MNEQAYRVAVIGFGAIGGLVAEHVSRSDGRMELVSVLVRSLRNVVSGSHEAFGAVFTSEREEFLASSPDVIVEAAGGEAVRVYGKSILEKGIDLVVASAGALADEELAVRLESSARRGGAQLLVPSGAVGGLDALKAASLSGLDTVVHTIRKPPEALLDEEQAGEVRSKRTPLQVFKGSARECVAAFPENTNVTATIGLVGIGLDQTTVRVIADPTVIRNTHELRANGAFGELSVKVENVPFPGNPKTSQLAAYSITSLLETRVARRVAGI